MPKIGKRILKSSFAVFLCFIIYLLRHEQGIVFYSCIAAVLCVQPTTSNTIKVARNRVEGTFIGGFLGMMVLLIEKSLFPQELLLLRFGLISIMIIPILYLTVVLKKTSASYISCVVFMSVTVSHALDINPFTFALDRMVDTLIGIFVALCISGLRLPCHRNINSLFYIDMEAVDLDSYTTIKVKQMYEHHAAIGFLCNETPGVFLPKLSQLDVVVPMLCYHGTLQYQMREQHFTHVHTFDDGVYAHLCTSMNHSAHTLFIHTVQYDMVHIYFDTIHNQMEQEYLEEHRRQPYDHYVCAHKPKDVAPFAIMVLMKQVEAQTLQQELQQTFTNVASCVEVWKEDIVSFMVFPAIELIDSMTTVAKNQQKSHIYLFLKQQQTMQSINDLITLYPDKNAIKTIRSLFYSFHKAS